MKRYTLIKRFVGLLILVIMILYGVAALAAKPEIVIFCAKWNMKCRNAQNVCRELAAQSGLKYTELDIDNPETQEKARELGVSYPSIPYIYYIDSKGNVVNGVQYKGESVQTLKQELRIVP